MQRFVALYAALDATTSTNAKVAAMRAYFEAAPPADRAWAVYFLSGRRIKRLVGTAEMGRWLVEATGLPDWLVGDCHAQVGDFAETAALLLDDGRTAPPDDDRSLADWVRDEVLALADMGEEQRRDAVVANWRSLDLGTGFVYGKLLTGALRVGVSQTLVVRALAAASGLSRPVVVQRLTGDLQPDANFGARLFAADDASDDPGRPYPFCLAYPLKEEPATLGSVSAWHAEWKWDGIRAQVIRRDGQTFIWTRGEELVTERFPEVADAAGKLPDGTVVDGELVGWKDGVLPFALLQKRIGRKTLPARLAAQVPVACLAFDLLEAGGEDWRARPLAERLARLGQVLADVPDALRVVPRVAAANWTDLAALRARSRERLVEGLMLKRLDSPYGTGRRKGDWWKWKIDPLTADVVMIYAQAGHGRRANLYTDYTFAVRDGDELKPVAKAYSGLSDDEIARLDRWIRANTLERYGPVRRVPPVQVFEIAFEAIAESKRHKSGVALRFPRIVRWRTDKTVDAIDTLATLRELL